MPEIIFIDEDTLTAEEWDDIAEEDEADDKG